MSAPKAAQPADLRLRRSLALQWARWSCLAVSWLLVFLLPLWHLRSIDAQGAGLAGEGPWAALARALPAGKQPLPLLGAPGALNLFGLELLDPMAVLSVLLSSGPSAKLLLGALPGALLVLLFGRFFCGWVCPYVTLLSISNATRALLARLGLRLPDRTFPRRANLGVLAVLLLASVAAGSQIAPLVYPPLVIGREVFRAVFYGGLGLGIVVVAFAFAFDTFVSRAGFCRYLCPGGALFSLLGAPSPIKVVRTPSTCTDCTACDAICNLLQNPMTDRLDAGCERCGKCISTCPTGALRFAVGVPAAFDDKRSPQAAPLPSPSPEEQR